MNVTRVPSTCYVFFLIDSLCLHAIMILQLYISSRTSYTWDDCSDSCSVSNICTVMLQSLYCSTRGFVSSWDEISCETLWHSRLHSLLVSLALNSRSGWANWARDQEVRLALVFGAFRVSRLRKIARSPLENAASSRKLYTKPFSF